MDAEAIRIKQEKLKAELAKMGIHTTEQLNEAIRNTKLDISIMASPDILQNKDNATDNSKL